MVNKTKVEMCVNYLLHVDIMIEHSITDIRNKPTHRMHQIAYAHKRSKEANENMIEEISTGVWRIQSSGPITGTYTVRKHDNSSRTGCPICSICIHQFACICPDYLFRGNFCKHIHACIRYSQPDGIHNNVKVRWKVFTHLRIARAI
jgi:hypothetical protein